MGYVEGVERTQATLFPQSLDEYIAEDKAVRFIDAFVAGLDLQSLGFAHAVPAATGRPPYDPADVLRLSNAKVRPVVTKNEPPSRCHCLLTWTRREFSHSLALKPIVALSGHSGLVSSVLDFLSQIGHAVVLWQGSTGSRKKSAGSRCFGVLVALDASLLGWLAQNYASASHLLVLAGTVLAIAVSFAIVHVNRLAYRRIEQLEDA